mmetsp:Transcript_87229/g.154519  ORF Transcript_87229/g.154519 Transcript_87229/m.154519 type:complete len:999 (-) Transcript_87229:101-3097(-)
MAAALQPPFDFAKEQLVTSSVELGTEKLQGGLNWLASCLQEQQQLLATLSGRFDALEARGAPAGASSQSLQASMKEEMVMMQLNQLRHEVTSLPRPGDMDRQRERLMAEVSSMSASLGDRQREADERMQREMANVTDTLCKQLERISDDVSSRLSALEERILNSPAPAAAVARAPAPSAAHPAPVAAQAQAQAPAQAQAAQSQAAPAASLAPPAFLPPAPLSPSSAAAEDTEDHTDGAPPMEMASLNLPPAVGGASLAELAAVEARMEQKMQQLERSLSETMAQLTELAQRPAEVQTSPASPAPAAAAPAADAAPPAAAAPPTAAAAAPAAATAPAAPVAAEAAVPAAASLPPAAPAAAPAAESAGAPALVAQTVTVVGAAESEALNAIRDSIAQLTSHVEEMKAGYDRDLESLRDQVQAAQSSAAAASAGIAASNGAAAAAPTAAPAAAPAAVAAAEVAAAAPAAASPAAASPAAAPPAEAAPAGAAPAEAAPAAVAQASQNAVVDVAAIRADIVEELVPLQQRLATLEESLRLVETALPEFKNAVPELEASIRKIEDALATVAESRAASRGRTPSSPPREVVSRELPVTASAQAPLEELEAPTGILPAPSGPDAELLEEMQKKLQALEDWQALVASRLTGPSPPATAPTTAPKQGNTEANTTANSWPQQSSESWMPNSEGPPGGRWKDVQAELERYRKLFEFIEGVLPQDAAEAMKFFNKSDKKEGAELSQTVTEAFGPEVDFERQKSKLENDFNQRTLAIQREFENLSVVLKGLQRESESANSKILDLGKRMTHTESEAKDFRMASPFTSMEEQPFHEPSPRDHAKAAPELPGDIILQPTFDKSLEDLREDVRTWLDTLRSSVLAALQTKADTEQVQEFIKQATGQNDLALFAKRSLLGKCASCEAPIEADLLRVKRPQPIAIKEPWPSKGESLGAQVAIRPLNTSGASPRTTAASSHGKLPKIADRSGHTQFPKGKVLKSTASSPDLRKDHADQ